MDAEEYLLQIQDITVRIKERKEQMLELRSTIKTISGIRYDSTKVSASVSDDQMANKLIRLERLEESIKNDLTELQEKKAEVMDTIMRVNILKLRELLILRYVNVPADGRMITFGEIANKINYSEVYTRKLHLAALNYVNSLLHDTK